jgi:V8-like Glu-specific endopeptidase
MKNRRSLFPKAFFLGAFTSVLTLNAQVSTSAYAGVTQGVHTVHNEAAAASTVEQFWTADRLRSARPIEAALRAGADGLPMASESAAAFNAPAVKAAGGLPSVAVGKSLQKVLVPPVSEAEAAANRSAEQLDQSTVIPDSTSAFGARFTTSRVFPDSTAYYYPYRTAGKLFFYDQGTGYYYYCSASVLRPRIIVTAGHCVTHASTNPYLRYFYSRFYFVPAYNNGYAPYGTWTPSTEWVSNAWYFSDGSVPNQQDVAMLIARDQSSKIGYITGWLGYWTGQLGNNNITMLGYPCNLDSCLKMEETFAQTYVYGGNNTWIYGSAMKGGASGGPWIQDFGISPVGAPAGLLGNNYLVGVTSYQPTNTALMYLGASNLDYRFINLLTAACGSATSGNCN